MANIVSINLNAQGAGDDFDEAYANAKRRLNLGNTALQADAVPQDPGVAIDVRDPGGGPCAPQKFSIEIFINQDVLPEAQNNDDD